MEMLGTMSFDDVKNMVKKEPYFLKIKDDGDLYLLHYTQKSDMKNEFVQKCYGLILEKNTNKPVCYSSNIIKEYPDTYDYKWDTTSVRQLIDGTVIKYYYYNEQWRMSTNKCIDANKSRWLNKTSFGELFKECKLDDTKLNTSYCYTFALVHPECRNIVPYTQKDIYHIGTRDMQTLQEVENDIGVQKPKQYEFKNFEDVVASLATLPYTESGYIVYDATYQRTKLFSDEYKKVKKMKGNVPNMNYRLLVLLIHDQQDEFLKYFPEYKPDFDKIQSLMNKVCHALHSKYVAKYINHQNVDVSESEQMILNHLHKDYFETKQPRTYKCVVDKFKKYSPKRIYGMLDFKK